MIKFFRKIRQKLLVENRFNKPASPASLSGRGGFSGFELLNKILV
jgi:hypothetical protein